MACSFIALGAFVAGGIAVAAVFYPIFAYLSVQARDEDWIIVGGESGPGARVWPGFADAARSLRDQCRAAGVSFFMKQMAGPRKATMPPIPEDLMIREFPQ